jgi:hypothetical protein
VQSGIQFEQVADRTQLAAYQARIADSVPPSDSSTVRMVVVPAGSFEQIVNQQQLAVYEAQMMEGTLPSTDARVVVMAAGAFK